MSGRQRTGSQSAIVCPAPHFPLDQPGIFQCPYVLRCCGQRHGKGSGQLTNRPFSLAKLTHHLSAGGIAESVENGIQSCVVIFNHVV